MPTETIKLTEKTVRALTILRDHSPLGASDFAEHMWPDHPGWSKRSKQGRGTAIGKIMWMMAGGYLGRLNKKGFLEYLFGKRSWRLSSLGQRVLAEHETRECWLGQARANERHPVRRDGTRNKAFISAWEKGYLARLSGTPRSKSPYPDWRGGKRGNIVTFSRAFWRYWVDGWDVAEQELCQPVG